MWWLWITTLKDGQYIKDQLEVKAVLLPTWLHQKARCMLSKLEKCKNIKPSSMSTGKGFNLN